MTSPEAARPKAAFGGRVKALADAVRALARAERRGDLASLRRLDPAHPFAPAFFALLAAHARWAQEEEDVKRCACLVQILAIRPEALTERSLGKTLAETFGETIQTRVQKLLFAGADALPDQARLIARRLAGIGVLPYREFGALLLARDETTLERARLAIAMDYWRALDRSDRDADPSKPLNSDPETD